VLICYLIKTFPCRWDLFHFVHFSRRQSASCPSNTFLFVNLVNLSITPLSRMDLNIALSKISVTFAYLSRQIPVSGFCSKPKNSNLWLLSLSLCVCVCVCVIPEAVDLQTREALRVLNTTWVFAQHRLQSIPPPLWCVLVCVCARVCARACVCVNASFYLQGKTYPSKTDFRVSFIHIVSIAQW